MKRGAGVVVGLDVGTTAVKAVVCSAGGGVHRVVERSLAPARGSSGATQNAAVLRQIVTGAFAEAAASVGGRIDAVAASTAMHGLVGLDGHAEPVTPVFTWADDRALPQVAAWHANGEADFVHRRTGVPIHPMAPVAKLAWLAREDPGTWAGVVTWVDLAALVNGWLTGENVTQCSAASGWGLMDIRTLRWDPDALALAGVTESALPAVDVPTATRPLLESVAAACGVARGAVVALGLADGPAANVGVGALDSGVAGLSLGTSGAIRVVVDKVPEAAHGLFCYALTPGEWVIGGAVSNGGNIVDWLASTFLDAGSGEEPSRSGRSQLMTLAGEAPPGCDGLVMVPYLVAERAPLWDATLPGAYLGVRARHGRAHFARAALEGVSAGLGATAEQIGRVAPFTEIRATGGALGHRLWRDLVAAAVPRPMAVVSTDEGSALGAAAVALVALGAADDLAGARRQLVFDETVEACDPPRVVVDAAIATRRTVRDSVGGLVAVADAFA